MPALPEHWSDLSDEPLYNIKAMAQRSGVTAATLRAWEQRHGVVSPKRSGGNYRLYSERDLAVIVWLKASMADGLSISRAVDALRRVQADGPSARMLADASEEHVERLRDELLSALVAMREGEAGELLDNLLRGSAVEAVCARVLVPVLAQVGEGWQTGDVSVAAEHFATHVVQGRLMAAFTRLSDAGQTRPRVFVGCAPGEQHEIAALMFALVCRLRGASVRFLGGAVPADEWISLIEAHKPDVVAISATQTEAAHAITPIARYVASRRGRGTRMILGGQAFHREPSLGTPTPGVHICGDIVAGAALIEAPKGLRDL